MGTSPDPHEIYARRAAEGRRRLDATPAAQASAAFTAGFVMAFGVAALGAAAALVAARFGPEAGELVGALALGVGLVFLVVARAELLFTENLLDPVLAMDFRARTDLVRLARLWSIALVVNLLGGGILLLILTASEVIPEDARLELARLAEEIAERDALPTLLNAVAGGALVTFLSWLLGGADSVGSRAAMAWLVGVLLVVMSLGHVVVTVLQMLAGLRVGGAVEWVDILRVLVLVIAGNLIGGFGFVTTTQLARAKAG